MSIIGPRPQLVRDMVFMTPEQRMCHTAKPSLSGLAKYMVEKKKKYLLSLVEEEEPQFVAVFG